MYLHFQSIERKIVTGLSETELPYKLPTPQTVIRLRCFIDITSRG